MAWTRPHKYCIDPFINTLRAILKLKTDRKVYFKDDPLLADASASLFDT